MDVEGEREGGIKRGNGVTLSADRYQGRGLGERENILKVTNRSTQIPLGSAAIDPSGTTNIFCCYAFSICPNLSVNHLYLVKKKKYHLPPSTMPPYAIEEKLTLRLCLRLNYKSLGDPTKIQLLSISSDALN